MTEAHQTGDCAELVCSNSFRSDDAENNAVGLLHAEMRRCGSLVMAAAGRNQVPAGGALAVDRAGFAAAVTAALRAEPLITIAPGEIAGLPPADWASVIVATGPLTSPALAEAIRTLTGADSLAFFDAIAPIVYKESIDLSRAWFQSRYDKVGPGGTGADYINCPLDRDQYDAFIAALLEGDKTGVPRLGEGHPLFRGLPADRGDGRARATDAAFRPDEAGRPDRPAHRPPPARGRPAAPGQCARHAVQHRRLSDEAEAWRAGPHLPHHPRPGAGRVRPPRRYPPQHLPRQPAPA